MARIAHLPITLDITFRTKAASTNRHVTAVMEVLNRHNIRPIGNYRGETEYAIYSHDPIPAAVLAELRALPVRGTISTPGAA